MKTYEGAVAELHAFLTLAPDGDSCQLQAPAALPSGKELELQEAGWGSELVWTLWREVSARTRSQTCSSSL
jgi:hypothetical protein